LGLGLFATLLQGSLPTRTVVGVPPSISVVLGRKERPPLRGAKTPAARALPTSPAPPARLPCNRARPYPYAGRAGCPAPLVVAPTHQSLLAACPQAPLLPPRTLTPPSPRPCVIASRPSAPPCLGACQRCFPHIGLYSRSPACPQTRALNLCLVALDIAYGRDSAVNATR
jgi:hypothetical protein